MLSMKCLPVVFLQMPFLWLSHALYAWRLNPSHHFQDRQGLQISFLLKTEHNLQFCICCCPTQQIVTMSGSHCELSLVYNRYPKINVVLLKMMMMMMMMMILTTTNTTAATCYCNFSMQRASILVATRSISTVRHRTSLSEDTIHPWSIAVLIRISFSLLVKHTKPTM